MNVSKSGNNLTIYANSAFNGTVTITGTKDAASVGTNNMLGLTGAGQTMVYGCVDDPVYFRLSVELAAGHLMVAKQSEDSIVSGLSFRITGPNNYDQTITTGSDGTRLIESLPTGTYTVTETSTPTRSVQPASQTVTVNAGQTTTASFSNVLKKWRVTVTKSDAELTQAQGDASLAGAVYGVYKGGVLMDAYTPNASGRFPTDYYVCGDDWTIKEITPSEGYLLDETVHSVGASAGNFTVERNTLTMGVTEQVIKGRISLIKHTDDGSTQIETPEEGAEFEVFLKSAGSYENAKDTERDFLTCDQNGYAETKDLPYGVYTVRQVSGWEGRELLGDFDVYISQDGEVYRYLINNANFYSYIKIVKTDAETGRTIPYAGAGFRIYDPDGNLVEMMYTYPQITTIDTFYTNGEGYLITPQTLPYGQGYSLVEVQAPYGYVLDETPVYFDVTQESSNEENGVTIIEVIKEDMPQKGIITVTKAGEIFQSVQYDEVTGTYQPVYQMGGLQGAVYEISAAEDIYTPDGTLRCSKGQIVDTITTGADGTASSVPLYLGRYNVEEVTAPHGYVVNGDIQEVELTYAGQEVELTGTDTGFYNERQKASLRLQKSMEQDELFGLGMNGEATETVFGLYARYELTAADGTVIPEGGLIETASPDEDGYLEFLSDLPFGNYYIKELSAHPAYLLDEAEYDLVFEYQGQDADLIVLYANEGEAVENTLLRGRIEGLKLDEGGESLPGAIFGLFHADETEFGYDNALLVSVSDADGLFWFDGIPYGVWMVHEIAAPEGYVLESKSFLVEISEHEQVIELEFVNRVIVGSVELLKVDKDTGKTLEHALFGLYHEEDAEMTEDTVLMVASTDADGIASFADIPYGRYIIREMESPEGYVLNETEFRINISEDGKVIELTVENQIITGTLELTKVDVADGAPLPAAGFRIRDRETGEIVAEGYTDENGLATFDLTYGKYTYQEVEAPEGYLIDETEFPFEITEDGQIVKATMTNQLAVGTIDLQYDSGDSMVSGSVLPNSGDSSIVLYLAALIGGLSMLAIAGTARMKQRKGMKHEPEETQ
ncbi:MAG: hypothetical protein LIO46_02960 [Clostridiales bacterium]|nr:hypothetical protein [Clostridiales bacterium]